MLKATIIDSETKEPIPYANVYNKRLALGTAANLFGYFVLPGNQPGDTVVISSLGFVSQAVTAGEIGEIINLSPSSVKLAEVVVLADDSYLYDMVAEIAKHGKTVQRQAKTYFYLKSEINAQPVEMIEAYYNGIYQDYGTTGLQLKKGRIGLQPVNKRYFSSTESSRLFSMFSLFNKHRVFPNNPLCLKRKALRREFKLKLASTYFQDGQKMYEINFSPRRDNGYSFSGTLWISKEEQSLLKVKLNISDAKVHPFIPLGFEEFQQVDMEITKTYQRVGQEFFIDAVDFNYTSSYVDRYGATVTCSTESFTKAYNFENTFTLPLFKFTKERHEDYRNITFMPYDLTFWESTREFRLYDRMEQIDKFVRENKAESNTLYYTRDKQRRQLEFAYWPWQKKRIVFKEAPPEKTDPPPLMRLPDRERYNLNVKLYLDFNYIDDTLSYQLAAVIDPIDTYYHFTLKDSDLAFINMYFDLMEIQKRKLEKALMRGGTLSPEDIKTLYNKHVAEFTEQSKRLTKETSRGDNLRQMETWNRMILEQLKVDNLELFRLKEPSGF